MTNETEHLRDYATTGAQDAFAAVVQRYLPLVYAAAMRRVRGDARARWLLIDAKCVSAGTARGAVSR